jgi:hypothetical protein
MLETEAMQRSIELLAPRSSPPSMRHCVMRKLASEPIGLWWQTGVERVGARRCPLAVFRNRFSGASRMTVPVLWDKASRLILSNESSEILRVREVAR